MENLSRNTETAIARVQRIPIVRTILEIICRSTGVGLSAVARVTPEQWVVCAVKDNVQFGLVPGSELPIETTFCRDICMTGIEVVFDNVEEDEVYRHHPSPAMYGFQSYLSVPIGPVAGKYWGTLCGIGLGASLLNNAPVKNLFKLYANLIALHLDAMENKTVAEMEHLEETTTAALQKQFAKIANHVDDGVDARKLPEQQRKAITATVERTVKELQELLSGLNKTLYN
ncbi:MAG: GAF domain-containing protein [Sphingobacteriales bacterium]|nr:MAG: GAF domain-containing protein [Sphingobacteriales bacterium]